MISSQEIKGLVAVALGKDPYFINNGTAGHLGDTDVNGLSIKH